MHAAARRVVRTWGAHLDVKRRLEGLQVRRWRSIALGCRRDEADGRGHARTHAQSRVGRNRHSWTCRAAGDRGRHRDVAVGILRQCGIGSGELEVISLRESV